VTSSPAASPAILNPRTGQPSDSGSDNDRDVVMEKVRGLSFSTCLQPTDPQYTATALCVAPAEGQHPLDFMLDFSCQALTFPAKFSFGVSTFTDERDVPITVKKYFIHRLLNWDKRFASDASYPFFAQYICEMKQIKNNITVVRRKTAGRMSGSVFSDEEQLRQLMKNDNAYQFLQNVRGSPAYFQRAVRELIAMVAQLGCPQFFLTLSSADMSWPELFRIIGQQSGRSMTDDDIAALSYNEKSSMLRNDPVLAARLFDHRLKAFFKDVLVGASALGPVRHYFYRTEFQMHGSPRAHCLLSTADGPDMSKATAEEIEQYFGTKVSGQLPSAEDPLHALVDRVQRHTHSVACRKGKDKHCRFSFPRPPSERTILATLPNDSVVLELHHMYAEVNAAIMKRVRDVLINSEDCSSMTLDDVLQEANITSEGYHNALAMSFSGRHLVLQRRPCDV